jgi:predicted ATPase/DNA-binding SARP family transcriptional activator
VGGFAVPGDEGGGPLGRARVRLLGPVDVVDDDDLPIALGGPKERLVLAVLAVHAGEIVSEERLIDALWGETPPRTATKTVQSYISRLRRALAGRDLTIESAPRGYVLRCGEDGSDVARLERLTAAARRAATDGDPDRAAIVLAEAERLWRGPVLGDLAGEPFAVAEAARLEELRTTVVEDRVEAELAAGRHSALVAELESLTSRYPLRERLWAARMLALYRCGRQADALRAYRDLRSHLGEELGIEPTPELAALEEAILLQKPELDAPAASQRRPSPSVSAAQLPSGVVTFLLTDVEGSTRLWESDFRAMDAAVAAHDAAIAAAVQAHGGVVLKHRGEGDSTFSVFWRTTHAAAAAIDAQQALASLDCPVPLRVRMAIHMGEAVERDGDYYGPAVNRAGRLRSIAAGGEILVSRAAAEVLADHDDAEWQLVELGQRSLKDLRRPEIVWALVPPRAVPASRTGLDGPPLAAALARQDLFVERTSELGRLDDLWREVSHGALRLALVAGEPGIGKTALAAVFARTVHAEGAIVLYGRCDDGLGVAFQPFAEALRALVASGWVDLRTVPGAGELTRLVPDLATLAPGLPDPVRSDAEAERWFLFEAVTATLAAASASAPVLLVLDDLHWAATPTLLLLRHLLRGQPPGRLLVVGTYRDTELDRTHPLAELLADLRRDAEIARLPLRGFDEKGVTALVEAVAGHELDDTATDLAVALHRETGGNPFFCGEILRHLVESGALYPEDGRWTAGVGVDQLGLPEGVREVIGRRLSRLSPLANDALTVGAVAGPRFTLRLLESVVDAPGGDLIDAVDAAVRAALVREAPGGYEFAHALVRQTLLAEVGTTRRMRLHRRVGEALEAIGPVDLHVEALAHHFVESAIDGQADKAGRYSALAARRARERAAFEEALRWAERGLESVDLEPGSHAAIRSDLLLVKANVHWELAHGPEGHEAALGAGQAALDARDPERVTAAAVLAERFVVHALVDDPTVALLEAGLVLAGDDHPDLRSLLLGARAKVHAQGEGRRDLAEPLAAEALALARQVGDAHVLAHALHQQLVVHMSDPALDDREALADELLTLREPLRDPFLGAYAVSHRGSLQLERGDRAAFEESLLRIQQMADATRAAWPRFFDLGWSAVKATLDGDWDRLRQTLAEWQLALPQVGTAGIVPVYELFYRWARGGVPHPDHTVRIAAEAPPDVPAFVAAACALSVEAGALESGRAALARWEDDNFNGIPRDSMWTAALSFFSAAAAALGAHAAAARLYELLAPFAGTAVAPASGTVCLGAVDRYLGMLATTLGRYEEAEQRFTAALALEEHGLRSRTLAARTWAAYGRMLLAKGDAAGACDVLRRALADATELAMPGVVAEVRSLLRPPLPSALDRNDSFVGRDAELGRVIRAWRHGRRAVLVAGEPGIGKTALASQLARLAYDEGATVLFGRCDDGLGVPYQPFTDALRSLVRPGHIDLAVAPGVGELVRIIPDLATLHLDLPDPSTADPETQRWLLFEAVAALLAGASATAPIVLVLDDLHWAESSTLLLLRHLLRADASMRLFVVGTYRDTELDRSHPLAGMLADLRRDGGAERVAVRGLDRTGVTALVEAAAGHDLDEAGVAFAQALERETGGNPFFCIEVLRHLAESGAVYPRDGRWTSDVGVNELGLPEGVREVIGRRLARLPDEANDALRVAAVIGSSFTVQLVEAVTGSDVDTLLDAFEAAAAAAVVRETRGGFEFAHALVRQTLLAELSVTRRARLHVRIAEAIAATEPHDVDALARHFLAAGGIHAETAARHALAAAHQAMRRVAYDEARTWAERGLEALEAEPDTHHALRSDLYVAHAGAMFTADGPGLRAALQVALRAVEQARLAGDPERLAMAAVTAVQFVGLGLVERDVALALEEALDRSAEISPALRVRVLSYLALYRITVSDRDAALAQSAEAVRIARELGDRSTLTYALAAQCHALMSCPGPHEGFTIAEELAAIDVTTDIYLQVLCTNAIGAMRFERGDRAGFEACVEAMLALPGAAGFARMWQRWYRVTLALLDGDWEAADAGLGEPILEHNPPDLAAWAGLVFIATRDRGAGGDLLHVLRAGYEANPNVPAFAAALATHAAEVGDEAPARELLAEWTADGFGILPDDSARGVGLGLCAESAARIGDRQAAAVLSELLAGFSGRALSVLGPVCIGAADRYLGMLAATLGRYDEAAARFEAALALEEAGLRSRTLATRTRLWYGRMLVACDDERAHEVLRTALADAEHLGMAGIAREVRALLD